MKRFLPINKKDCYLQMDAFARCSISTNWRPSSGTLSNVLEPNVPWSVSIRQGTLWRSDLGDSWSQRNSERALWMGCRVWLLLSNVLGPGIYKPDPAGEYTKHYLRETVYSFCKSFLDCNFRSQRLIAKSRVKSLRFWNEGEPGVDTESFR